MILQLRQVEIRTGAFAQQSGSIVKEEKAKIKQRRGDRLLVHQKMFFVQMPSAWPHHQSGQIRPKPVLLPFWAHIFNRSTNRIPQILLALKTITPRGEFESSKSAM